MAPDVAFVVTLAVLGKTPYWKGPQLNHSQPLGGLSLTPDVTHTEIYHGGPSFGTYNHAAMLDYFNGTFLLAWKNGPSTEDKDGQRILYSQSIDGKQWSRIDSSRDPVLFPSLTTSELPCAMFVGPPIQLNGRWYVGASPGEPTGAAQGAQFCLWPDPVTPRNCGPPHYPQSSDTLLLRQILGIDSLGPMFWASNDGPDKWRAATKQYNIRTLNTMPTDIQNDVNMLHQNLSHLPCADPESGNLKCEACLGGCQLWDDINIPPTPVAGSHPPKVPSAISNERSHYTIPSLPKSNYPDVILYRSGSQPFLYASSRPQPGQHSWQPPRLTTIPNDESNLNTGTLPDGRIYLLNNAVYTPKNDTHALGDGTLRFRDPLVLSISQDGYGFENATAVISCAHLPNNSTCVPRYTGGGKNPGPSYPQGLVITAPAPIAHRGFYVVATNNKEDVWLTKIDFGQI